MEPNPNWHKGNEIGKIYQIVQSDIDRRVANCWLKKRLHVNDAVICLHHGGDAFYYYCLLELFFNAVRIIPESIFGSYFLLGPPIEWQPTSDEFKILMDEKYIYHNDAATPHPIWAALKEQ